MIKQSNDYTMTFKSFNLIEEASNHRNRYRKKSANGNIGKKEHD